MSKTLTLKLTGYIVKGTADLTCWGGGNGSIKMTPFKVGQISIINDEKLLIQNLNDAGFGVEKINGAICEIYENYQGTLKYLKTVEVGKISESTQEAHSQGEV